MDIEFIEMNTDLISGCYMIKMLSLSFTSSGSYQTTKKKKRLLLEAEE